MRGLRTHRLFHKRLMRAVANIHIFPEHVNIFGLTFTETMDVCGCAHIDFFIKDGRTHQLFLKQRMCAHRRTSTLL